MPQSQQNALGLTTSITNKLRAQLPAVAAQTVAAIISEVPGYAGALDEPMGEQIEGAVEMALGGFLKLAARAQDSDPGSPLRPALDAAYSLGRGEARNGRSMDALLAAYRVGARVAWRELSGVAVTGRAPAATMAQFAELVFAYIDELSAASVSGHADQLATADRAQQRYLDRFTRSLLAGDSTEVLLAAAERAGWSAPDTLTAVLLPGGPMRDLRALAGGAGTLVLADDLPRFDASDDNVALLVPDVDTVARRRLRRSLSGHRALIGPTRPWLQAARSYERVVRAYDLGLAAPDVVDTEEHLTELVLHSDAEALADLRAQVLAPMVGLRATSADKLTETLRAWLLHHGRREDVAAALFVHPQTVRYRMGQLRELYGDRLDDPSLVLAASIALGTMARDNGAVQRTGHAGRQARIPSNMII